MHVIKAKNHCIKNMERDGFQNHCEFLLDFFFILLEMITITNIILRFALSGTKKNRYSIVLSFSPKNNNKYENTTKNSILSQNSKTAKNRS